MRRLALALALLGGLAGCAGGTPHIVGAPPPGVSYRFEGNDVAAASRRAQQYCERYGRTAHLQAVNRAGEDNVGVFECR